MSSTQHQLIEQCATRLRGIVEALDNIHHTSPQRWLTDLDDVHSSAESLLALINDQAPTLDSQGLAGAALAQPSPAPELPERGTQHRFSTNEQNCRHDFAGVWWNDNGETKTGRECRHCGFFVADVAEAAAEQAEAERPEVVGVRYEDGTILSAEDCGTALEVCAKVQTPLMTVAQHERIAASRWERAMDLMGEHVARISEKFKAERDAANKRADTLEHRMMGMMTRHFAEAWRNRDTQKALDGYLSAGIAQLEQERDAALANVDALAVQVLKLGGTISFAHHRTDQAGQVPQAWLDVQVERRRQVEAEGWTPEHDDEHSHGQMARAAACYALAGSSAPNDGTAALLVSLAWPWDEQWWKPSTARRDMVKACALGLAEIERLDRVAASQGGPSDA
ncbi:hypothetical protein IPC665_07255 [Pseudomonas aeruginosa]|uniref:hypothetical protein n=1 Tax=Pseudomonas aeruginosa TaxID=287 RepID=UPI000FEE12B8|nr:hypothetical protein [Pseudomonas aeruginosa]MCV4076424.1 hypothetical protein [Pseudomonas aeruginosa]RPY77064.1 hypothetical protein IPC665_07255 [Pseudomonas aeruginosa]